MWNDLGQGHGPAEGRDEMEPAATARDSIPHDMAWSVKHERSDYEGPVSIATSLTPPPSQSLCPGVRT